MAIANKIVKNDEKFRVHTHDPLATEKIHLALKEKLAAYGVTGFDSVILLCIGTDRSTGDCLGPLVGSLLDRERQDFFRIYGTLDYPVHAANLQEHIDSIHKKYNNPFIIAIDACLGSPENVGCINICEGPLQPGAGVNKSLPTVGDIYITGIVNVGGFMEYLVLQNTRLNLVMRMTHTLVQGLLGAALEYTQKKARSG
ncbi:MAG: spore protease YyaC [Firmicutes bacterium]|nr:spore protease YyaC [Bacillota bacterium]